MFWHNRIRWILIRAAVTFHDYRPLASEAYLDHTAERVGEYARVGAR